MGNIHTFASSSSSSQSPFGVIASELTKYDPNIQKLHDDLSSFLHSNQETRLLLTRGNHFAIHGGCIRDAILEIKCKDYDIVFSSLTTMQSFVADAIKKNRVRSIQKTHSYDKYPDCENCLSSDPTLQQIQFHIDQHKDESYHILIQPLSTFSGMKIEYDITGRGDYIILDMSAIDYVYFALDFTVNGLFIDYVGEIQSKSVCFDVKTIVQHITDKKLISIDISEEVDRSFSQQHFFTRAHHYASRIDANVKKESFKARTEKMLGKGFVSE
jgi:hypothetical protein